MTISKNTPERRTALCLLYNKDERTIARQLLAVHFESVTMASSAEEALNELLNADGKAPLDLLILDERFEMRATVARAPGSMTPLESVLMAEYLDEARRVGRLRPESLVGVIMGEGRDAGDSLAYRELGADEILYRPLSAKELKTASNPSLASRKPLPRS